MTSLYIKALSNHLKCTTKEAREKFQNGDYRVISDSEVFDAVKEEITQLLWAFRPSFLANFCVLEEEHIKLIQDNNKCEDNNDIFLRLVGDNFDKLVREAILSDGEGHFLAPYDGLSHEIELSDYDTGGRGSKIFYVFRQN